MKILIVASGNAGYTSPFVLDQIKSLEKLGIQIDLLKIKGKGVFGYLKNYFSLISKIKSNNYNLIHAHYGLSGLLASFQWKIPVIITFHGSDINKASNYPLSFIASRFSDENIFVHPAQPRKLKIKNNYIIPCGVDLSTFYPIDKFTARNKLGWDQKKKYIIFSSHFNNPVKNVDLAHQAIKKSEQEIEFIELKGYSKEQVCTLMNGADLLLVTSKSETGPIVVKEAMACNCPIISTDVGDVSVVINKATLCFVLPHDPIEIAAKINIILKKPKRSNGRNYIYKYDLYKVAVKVESVYKRFNKYTIGR
ncbi:MAG: glycosyltransferase [Candidatus Marinimicrobia bacterium]|nr:glycosyltransferase [Candidatus Neomarinimicrobiota bacterium]